LVPETKIRFALEANIFHVPNAQEYNWDRISADSGKAVNSILKKEGNKKESLECMLFITSVV
jgi:hypothetical protein